MLELMVVGAPVPKGRPKFSTRNGFITAYTPAKTRNAEKDIEDAFKAEFPNHKPLDGPIRVRLHFWMPIPSSLSQKKKQAIKGTFHSKKPDLDNLVKLVTDALNGVAWKDDNQIVKVEACKTYCYGNPGTFIEVEEVIN